MKTILRNLVLLFTLVAFVGGSIFIASPPAAFAATVTVTAPVYTPPNGCLVGAVVAPNTAQYTFAASGPNGARMYTATLVDPVNDSFTGPNQFGPYNLNAVTPYPNPVCQPYFTIDTTSVCGTIKLTFHNPSNWNWSPDYHYTGDGVTPVDYGSGPTWKNVFVQRGTSKVIFNYTFPEDYNGGTVDFSYQSLLGPITQNRVAMTTVTISTNCATPPALTPVTVVPPTYTAPNACLVGGVVAPATAEYTWAESGPDTARIFTAVLVDNVNSEFIGQNVFGPYDVTAAIDYLNPTCQPYFTVDTPVCGKIQVTFHNHSNWDWNPDYTFTGDGVTPVDYNGTPTYTRVLVPRGTSAVIFDYDFAEDYNGGSVNVSYQSVVGGEPQVEVAAVTVAVTTDCVTPPVLTPITVVEPTYTAVGVCLDGLVNAPPTADYTWAESGPMTARMFTAVLVDAVNSEFIGQNVFGPYDVTQATDPLGINCKPYFTVGTSTHNGIQITFHNPSNWDWTADYHYTGDGVTPVDYNGTPTYTRVLVPRGTSVVIFDYVFPDNYNGGSVNVSYQAIIGPVGQVGTSEVTVAVSTLAAGGSNNNGGGKTNNLVRTGIELEGSMLAGGSALLLLLSGIVLLVVRRRTQEN